MHRSWVILVIVAIAGACTMTVELSAVRLLAPWFGTSSGVWTNVIGVVLLSLSAGYLCGAWLSEGARPEQSLAWSLLLAASVTAWIPGATSLVAGAFIPSGLTLEEAAELLDVGSLAAALVLFLPCTLLLGCIPPLAGEVVQRLNHKSAGNVGGRVLAASTVGSIGGTFLTTYVALPIAGLDLTFWAAACVLGVLGSVILLVSRAARARAGLAILVPVALAARWSRLTPPAPMRGGVVLERAESSYQSVRVVEQEEGGARMRYLQVNEGLDSFQSVWQEEPGLLPPGHYYNLFVLPAWWSRAEGNWTVLVLGLGAGTVWRVLDAALPPSLAWDSVGVEIDPKVVALGHAWFTLPKADPKRRVLVNWDGRAAARQIGGSFDAIILDAYANQTEIPAHLSTHECFVELRDRLTPDGWLSVNVGGFGLTDPVVTAVATTVAASFGNAVLVVRVPFSRNCVVFARRSGGIPDPGSSEWFVGDARIDTMLGPLAMRGAWTWVSPGQSPEKTDDRNDIDRLQRRSLAAGAVN